MIKATELRKNNLVIRDGEIVEVGWNALGFDDVPDNPIPLTPEILEKAGFVDVNNGYRATGAEVIYSKKVGDRFKIDLWESIQGYTIPYYHNPIMYVHQLQNLYFALTGEELNITHKLIIY